MLLVLIGGNTARNAVLRRIKVGKKEGSFSFSPLPFYFTPTPFP